MKEVRKCVVCNSEELSTRRARVAPFLAERIWHRSSFPATLLACKNCGFVFFNPRLDAPEEERLYSGYRGDDYQETRYACEPWYTRNFHRGLFSEETMRGRRESLKRLLAPHLTGVRAILDFGGGRGELIADLVPGADRYVYDVAGVEPLPGIVPLQTLTERHAHHFDLIVCSNVLEHVAYPRDIMEQIVRAASPGTLVFLEVPYESPVAVRQKLKRLLQQLVLLMRRPRIGRGLMGPGMLCVMHEHVNFFSTRAMNQIVASAGLSPVDSGVYGERSFFHSGMLWTLAQMPKMRPQP